MTGTATLAAAGRKVWWYVREVIGDTAYERYVAHLHRHHPGAEAPSRREFERMRTDAGDDPRKGFRCC